MGRYLVVANQTLGGERLIEEVRSRIADGPSSFYVVAPQTPVPEPAAPVAPGTGTLAGAGPEAEEARRRAEEQTQSRLTELINRIRAEGGEADGEVGVTDPVEAVASVLEDQSFDEIVVSTLPEGVSRWLRMDVAHRIERRSKLPVTVVTARQ